VTYIERIYPFLAMLVVGTLTGLGTACIMRLTADTDHVLLAIKDHRIAILKDTADTQDKTIKTYMEIFSRLRDSGCQFKEADGL